MRNSAPRSQSGRGRRSAAAPNGCRLRELRREHGLSQQDLAERAGVHRNSVSRFERGVWNQITPEHAAALAAVLGVASTELGLQIRPVVSDGAPRSVRFRQLTPQQRKFVDDLMSLPPDDFAVMHSALEYLLRDMKRKAKRRK
jgi:transcriptional regulator with XRE-family HTH domain